MLTPDSRVPGISLYAGVPAFPESAVFYSVLAMNKDMRSYYYLKASKRMVHPADFTQYVIASEQLMGIFETALIQGQSLAAYACRYSFDASAAVLLLLGQPPGSSSNCIPSQACFLHFAHTSISMSSLRAAAQLPMTSSAGTYAIS